MSIPIGSTTAIVLGGAAGLGIAGASTRGAFLHDMLADPNQVIQSEEGVIVERPRPKLGPLTMLGSMVVGALVSGGGAAWRSHALQQAQASGRIVTELTKVATHGMLGLGAGAVMGGVAAAMLYQDATIRRV